MKYFNGLEQINNKASEMVVKAEKVKNKKD